MSAAEIAADFGLWLGDRDLAQIEAEHQEIADLCALPRRIDPRARAIAVEILAAIESIADTLGIDPPRQGRHQ